MHRNYLEAPSSVLILGLAISTLVEYVSGGPSRECGAPAFGGLRNSGDMTAR